MLVITSHRTSDVASAVRRWSPQTHIHVVTSEADEAASATPLPPETSLDVCLLPDDLRVVLASGVAPQLVVDVAGGPRATICERFRRMFLAVAPGGWWVVAPRPDTRRAAGARAVAELADTIRRGADAGREGRQMHRAIGTLLRGPTTVAVHKQGSHVVKLREQDVEPVAARRGWDVRTLRTLPASAQPSRATLSTNRRERAERLFTRFDVPPLHLREQRHVVCAPLQLTMADGVVLPSSFHHPSVTRTRSRALTGSGQWFTGEPSWSQPPGRLDGPFFHLDSEFPGHFGHLLTEDVAKLWGWDEAKQRHPDLRVLRSSGDHGQFAPWELELLGGYGIGEDEVVDLREPVIVDLLVTASQQFHNGKVRYAHGDLATVWARLRDGIRSGTVSSHERVFITRSAAKRSCRNRAAVEALFAARGFHVVHPETMALADQVELFAGATVVAGFGGSGMFGTIYSPPGTRIVVTSEEYKASNEYLIASVTGGDYHHFDCPIGAQLPDAPNARSLFHRNFAFDFTRDEPALDRVLDALDEGTTTTP